MFPCIVTQYTKMTNKMQIYYTRMSLPAGIMGVFMYGYPDCGFSVLFPQLQGKCQGKTRKDGARPALFLIFVLFYVLFVL